MPSKKAYISISLETHQQKRLLLSNLKELYQEFKVKNPTIGIGLSKFASLCPKLCVAIAASGTHLVCVCSIHQNATLLCSASALKVTYKDLINMIVYNSQNKHCMKHHCQECQGKNNLKNYLVEDMLGLKESDNEYSDTEINFSIRVGKDRANLITQSL